MSVDTVTYQHEGRLALIGMHGRDESNAIDPETFDALGAAYHRADADAGVVAVVLHADGPNFSVGLDPVPFLPVLRERAFSLDGAGRVNPFGTSSRLSKPLVVAVQGAVGAMANELVLAADVRVAAEDARFSQGEPSRGTTPAGGGGVRMPLEVGWANAMRWILTGETWSAHDALRLGLVQEVVPVGDQVGRAVELAEKIAAHPPLALRETLRLGRRAWEGHAHHVFADLLPALHQLMATDDFAERLAALRENRPPVYTGA